MKQSLIILLFISFLLVTGGCQRIVPDEVEMGQLERINIADVSTIPATYGKLVSATSVPSYPNIIQLWFEDSLGTIRMVRVGFQENRVYEEVLIINRK